MPENQAIHPITDQEIAFAHLVLSGTMTDRQAAEAAGLNPDTAASTRDNPRVRAYMLDPRAAVPEPLVQQATEALRPLNIGRERVLTRLWQIADMPPEMTRSSITGQVKALSMIIAIEGLIPDRRAGASAKKPDPPPLPNTNIYVAEWLRKQKAEAAAAQASPDLIQDEEPVPDPPHDPAADAPAGPGPAPGSHETIPVPPVIPSETIPPSPYARVPGSAPDLRLPLSMQINPFGRRR